jgi:hypothetical protein
VWSLRGLDLECVLVDRVLWCLVWVMVRLSDRGTGNGERERELCVKLSFWLISGSGVVVWFWRRGGCELEVRLAGS